MQCDISLLSEHDVSLPYTGTLKTSEPNVGAQNVRVWRAVKNKTVEKNFATKIYVSCKVRRQVSLTG